MSRSTKPSAAASTSRPTTGRAPRASTSKQVDYIEQDEFGDMELDVEGGEDFEDEEESDPEIPTQSRTIGDGAALEMARILATVEKSRLEKNKEKLVKVEKKMQGVLDKGKRDADAAIKAQLDKNVTLMQSAHLNRATSHAKRSVDDYEKRFADMQKNAQLVSAAIDEIVEKDIKTDETECVGFAKEAFEARARSAKRTYKKLSKTSAAIREEAYALAEDQQQNGETVYRGLKAAARA
ncbi:hypothetical protein JCM10449v2_001901 [Rhodotorula kratochvilovae]